MHELDSVSNHLYINITLIGYEKISSLHVLKYYPPRVNQNTSRIWILLASHCWYYIIRG